MRTDPATTQLCAQVSVWFLLSIVSATGGGEGETNLDITRESLDLFGVQKIGPIIP